MIALAFLPDAKHVFGLRRTDIQSKGLRPFLALIQGLVHGFVEHLDAFADCD